MSTNSSPQSPQLRCGDCYLDLSEPQVMAVINVTPDSFSDGGVFHRDGVLLDKVLARVEQVYNDGAAIVDIGGESTRPGAASVGADEECARVLPVVEAIAARFDVIISVDTSTPRVMREAAACGAGMINDVRALSRDGALRAAANSQLPVCLMHMQGEPDSMQRRPEYVDILAEVKFFLHERVAACAAAGIDLDRIVLDPGFGFGKTLQHNIELFKNLLELRDLPCPLLVGVSRKSMIGAITGRDVAERVAGSAVLAAMAVERGASIIRAHDIRETVDAIKLARAVQGEVQRYG
ncbi:MAG: dihydropteroate synthase [Spongiibacteraceae bacterium]